MPRVSGSAYNKFSLGYILLRSTIQNSSSAVHGKHYPILSQFLLYVIICVDYNVILGPKTSRKIDAQSVRQPTC